MPKTKTTTWECYGRYAEDPAVTFKAQTFEEAEKKAAKLAAAGRVSPGYRENGSLCPIEVR